MAPADKGWVCFPFWPVDRSGIKEAKEHVLATQQDSFDRLGWLGERGDCRADSPFRFQGWFGKRLTRLFRLAI